MEFNKLNNFIIEDLKSPVPKTETLLSRKISSVNDLIKEVKHAKNKEHKLYKITKEISSVIDLYDDSSKIKLDRSAFLKNYFNELENVINKNNIEEYKEIMSLIVNDTVKYDNANWNLIYDNIKQSVSEDNKIINKNVLYSLDFERLVPKKLVSLLKEEKNDMIEGGFFSFQSYTQEMLGIINEFVLLKGHQLTKMYLDQGRREDIKIIELLKEVNAASVVEPFSFSNGEPFFQKASNGQLDGFIIHKDEAKVILATKNENTTIEGDSIFRHFITGLLIKKKIDEIEPNNKIIKNKMQFWIDYYTNDNRISEQIKQLKKIRRKFKKDKNKEINNNDFYIDNEFIKILNSVIHDAEERGLKEVKIPLKLEGSLDWLIDVELIQKEFKLPIKGSKTNFIKMDLNKAKEKLYMVSQIAAEQQEDREELIEIGFNKVLQNPKFKEQIIIDAKKAEITEKAGFLSIRKMISHYNKNTKQALEELGVLSNTIKKGSPLDILRQEELDQYNIPEVSHEDMDSLMNIAKKHNVELIYYGSVSNKKQVEEYHYNDKIKLTNKEFRYGLNTIAYANILSDSVKDRFKISTEAALEFVNHIQLRTVTHKNKNGFDLDIERINKKEFIPDILHTIFKGVYENNIVKNDSVDFYENLFNATNVLLADVIEDLNVANEYSQEHNILIDYKNVFSNSIKGRTNKNDHYDIVKIFDTIKNISVNKSSKFVHGNSIIEAVNNKVNKIIEDTNIPELKELKEKYNPKKENNKRERNRRINRLF